jgi:NAD(P)-dependent dehydrogenase (short-subunit alcohol dehydrogenase family)
MTGSERVMVVMAGPSLDIEQFIDRLVALGERVALIGAQVSSAALSVPGDEALEPTAALQRVEQELGPIASLVCVTAVPPPAPFVGGEIDQWSATVSNALTQPFQMIRASLPNLRRNRSGRIVLIGAGWLLSGRPERTAAAAVHGGLVALVKTLGRELGRDGISVNEVVFDADHPPPVAVIADTVGYLCGPYAAGVVGQLVTVGSPGEARP